MKARLENGRGTKYPGNRLRQVGCAVLRLGLLSEISFASLFAYNMSCFNSSHIPTTACVLGKITATEYVLETDKDKVFPVEFTAFYLPLALIDSEEPKKKSDKFPLTSKPKLYGILLLRCDSIQH